MFETLVNLEAKIKISKRRPEREMLGIIELVKDTLW